MEGEHPVFDDEFVRAAPVREADLGPPSRESLREVKREARARRRTVAPPRRHRPRPSRDRVVGGLLVVALLVGVGVYAAIRLPGPPKRHRAAPVVVPSYSPPPRAPHDRFADSPVARWPVGAAGLRAPAAAPLGTFTSAQVADAYARTVAIERAALLDRTVLYGRATAPVLSRLGGAADYWAKTPASLMTRFDPATVVPASDVVRVNGRMTVSLHGKALQVTATYVAVYVLRPAHGPATAGELVAIRHSTHFDYYHAAGSRVGGAWVQNTTYISDHSACGTNSPRDATYTTVLFEQASASPAASSTPAGPLPTFDILDPTAAEPDKSCFTDTSGLR